MSLRFIYGKSGTGKTSYCFDSMAKLIKNNQKVYMITPEQFSFTAEKNLMKAVGKEAVMNAEVITFERMAYRMINEVGGNTKASITDCGKAMLLAFIMEQQKKNLEFLGKTDKNLDLILRMITEFKKNNVTTQLLKEKIDIIQDPYLKIKLQDASLLYERLNGAIMDQYLNEDDLLTLAKGKISLSTLFQDAYLYIDEFSGFTKQEYSMIEELCKVAKEVNITMCTDSLEKSSIIEKDIFAPNKNTILKLKELAKKNHIRIENPVYLDIPYRYHSKELKLLSDQLYSFRFAKYPEEVENIQLFLATNSYSEIEHIANQIIELVREKGYFYHEISIITKEVEEYASLIRSIFTRYEIPVFIDEKKDIHQNILAKYLIAVLNVFAKSFRIEEIINYLKIGLLDELTEEEIYLFENYCKKCGITGLRKLETEFTIVTNEKDNLEVLNKIRTKVMDPFLTIKKEMEKNKTVGDITKLLYQLIENNHIKEKIFQKIEKWSKEGKIELANTYETSWNIFIAVLEELVRVLGNEKISFENYIKILKIGFEYSSLGKIPATLDEVIVGDVDRTRSAKKKVIFIIGLNDGKFPSIPKSEGYINDDERMYLKEQGIDLAKTTKEQLYDENFNIYKAFSVAEEKLYLSYAASDKEGRGLRKSILINQIKKIFPSLKEESDLLQTNQFISSKEITFETMLQNMRKYINGEKIDPIWIEIHQLYKEDKEYQNRLQKAMDGLHYQNLGETIQIENLKKMYGDTLTTSISKLESYQRCPFSYYLQYGLKLSDRTELKIEKIDTGTFMHDIIDTFFEKIKDQKQSLKEITEEEIDEIIEEVIEYKLQLKKNYIFQSTSKYMVLTKRLKKVIKRAIYYMIYTLQNSDFQVLGTEIAFGKGKTYPPIQIQLEDGKKVELIGKIDRVDVAESNQGKFIRVIDYKSSIKNIDLNEVMAGIQIQLLTYLDAVSKKENADAAGILYFNLIEPVIKAKNKHLSEEELEQEIRNHFKMNGFILADVQVVKMMDHGLTTGSSAIVPAYLDKEGNLSTAKSNVLQKEDFARLQNKVEKIMKQIAEGILSGNIEQNPIYLLKNKRTACEFCAFKAICGFDSKMCQNNYRFIPNLSKNEILSNLKDGKL